MSKNTYDTVAIILLIIGGINWGLVGLFKFDLVAEIFGGVLLIQNLIYILVGISALYTIYYLSKD